MPFVDKALPRYIKSIRDALASPGDAEKHREVVESSDILMDGLKVVWAAEKRIDFDN